MRERECSSCPTQLKRAGENWQFGKFMVRRERQWESDVERENSICVVSWAQDDALISLRTRCGARVT